MAPGKDSLTVFFAKGNKLEEVNSVLFSGHKPGDPYSHFSNFYMESFKDDSGITYSCGEAYFQAGKAWEIWDKAKFAQIAHAKSGYEAKKLGNELKGLDVANGDKISSDVMRNALYYKYRNNPAKREDLINTGNKCLVEAREDPVWGTGLKGASLALNTPISQWPGDNKLGEELMRARRYFKSLSEQENIEKGNEHFEGDEREIIAPFEEIEASNVSNERKRKFDQTLDKLVESNKTLLKKMKARKGIED